MHQQKQNNIMEKITVYKTSDGMMFEIEKEAIAAEKYSTLKKRLRDFAEQAASYSEQQELLFDSIIESKSLLFIILKEYFEE